MTTVSSEKGPLHNEPPNENMRSCISGSISQVGGFATSLRARDVVSEIDRLMRLTHRRTTALRGGARRRVKQILGVDERKGYRQEFHDSKIRATIICKRKKRTTDRAD